MKIVVIGFSGSGKSTLAKDLGRAYHIPVLHLDRVHWTRGWKERPLGKRREIVRNFMDTKDSWVIVGNYNKLEYERRLFEADQIVFMNFNRLSCLYRVWKRYWKYRGRTREDMGKGCMEKLDLEFVWWILYKARTRKKWMEYKKIMRQYKKKMMVISNQNQLNAYKKGFLGNLDNFSYP